MNRDSVNYKEMFEQLLWKNIVRHKNKGSGYFKVDRDESDTYPKGEIFYNLSAVSGLHPDSYHELTWKELAIELGIFEDLIVPDGHDCKECPYESTCTAHFKYDPDQERCSAWVNRKPFSSVEEPTSKTEHEKCMALTDNEIDKLCDIFKMVFPDLRDLIESARKFHGDRSVRWTASGSVIVNDISELTGCEYVLYPDIVSYEISSIA